MYKAGDTYIALRQCEEIEINGETVIFEETRHMVIVLEKPVEVIVDDGSHQETVKLPKHLASNEWLLVENLTKGITHWLNVKTVQLMSAD